MSTGAGSNLQSINAARYANYAANTAGVQVVLGPGIFYGIQGLNAGTAWTATVYDNNAASGPLLAPSAVTITVGTVALGIPPDIGIWFNTGLFLVLAGTTAGSLNILYQNVN